MRQVHALRAARLSQDAARDASDWRNFFNFACRQSVRDHDKD
jgi:site-specific recombinase XerD